MIVDFNNYDGNSGLKPDMITQYLEERLEQRDDQTVVAAGQTLQENTLGEEEPVKQVRRKSSGQTG